jgi:hypothetical protein
MNHRLRRLASIISVQLKLNRVGVFLNVMVKYLRAWTLVLCIILSSLHILSVRSFGVDA